MLTDKKHIQYFYNQSILDRNVSQGLQGARSEKSADELRKASK